MTGPAVSEEKLNALLSALQKFPPHGGITYRGIPGDALDAHREGEALVTTGLTATSRDIRIATENATAAGLYVVVGRTGRAIESASRSPHEREVVFLPATLFRVARHARLGDLPVVLVEQLDPRQPPAPTEQDPDAWQGWLRTAAQAHMAALKMDQVPITSPGKFVGVIE